MFLQENTFASFRKAVAIFDVNMAVCLCVGMECEDKRARDSDAMMSASLETFEKACLEYRYELLLKTDTSDHGQLESSSFVDNESAILRIIEALQANVWEGLETKVSPLQVPQEGKSWQLVDCAKCTL
jgi:hypothetical protein